MSFLLTIKTAFKALYQNKLRAFLTMLGIIIGIASVVIIVSIGQGTVKAIEDDIGIAIGGINTINIMPTRQIVKGINKGLAKTLIVEDIKAIENECPFVIHSSPVFASRVQVIYKNENCSFPVVGVSENYTKIKNWEVSDGEFFTEEDLENGNQVCVLGHKVFEDIFHGEYSIDQFVRLNNIPFRVVGVMTEQGGEMGEDNFIFIPHTTFCSRIKRIRNMFGMYCSITSYEYIEEAKENIRAILRQRHKNLRPEDEDDFRISTIWDISIEEYTKTTKTLTLFLLTIASMSLLVGGIGIMNIMLVSVNERIREIGIRMSLGARRIDILKQFLLESMILSFMGGLIGIILGIIISEYIPHFFPDLKTVISLDIIIISFIFSVGVGIFFGFYPAWQASKFAPIDALRNESDSQISLITLLKSYKESGKLISFGLLLKLLLQTIFRDKMKEFLAMLGIIIGIASVITMISIGQGSSKSIQDSISLMGKNLLFINPEYKMVKGIRNGYFQTLKIEDSNTILNECSFVTNSSPVIKEYVEAKYNNREYEPCTFGVLENYFEIKNCKLSKGEFFTDEDVVNGNKVCVIGDTVLKELFNGEDPIDQFIRFNNKVVFRVIGVLQPKGKIVGINESEDESIFIPYTIACSRIKKVKYLDSIVCSISSDVDSEYAIDEIRALLRQRHHLREDIADDFIINTQISIKELYEKTTGSFTLLLSSIAFLSLLVGGIGIMNIMLVSVTGRTKEIGIKMSVGARRIDILKQFLFESIRLSVSGGIIGIISGIVISQYVPHFFPDLSSIISIEAIIISFLFSVGVGIFFGFYPAWQASKLDPIEALRYE